MAEKMGIYEKLSHIQNEMKVPKNLYNKFGNYYYRNAESILESAKPICAKYKTTLFVEDSIEYLEGRFYVRAVATLMDWESAEMIQNVAFARECDKKIGMDDSQLTGSCSSYARKYALNGLFCLDDVKDADTDEQETERNERAKKSESKQRMASEKQIGLIVNLYSKNEIMAMLKRMNKKDLKELTLDEASKMISTRGGE